MPRVLPNVAASFGNLDDGGEAGQSAAYYDYFWIGIGVGHGLFFALAEQIVAQFLLCGRDHIVAETNEKVEHLFLAALSRKPTSRELPAIAKILASAKDKPAIALEDIWWALLNSNEFILDH